MNVDSDTLSNGPKWLFYFVEKKLLALAHDGSLCSLSQWLDSSSPPGPESKSKRQLLRLPWGNCDGPEYLLRIHD